MIQRLVANLVTNEVADLRRRVLGLALVGASFLMIFFAAGFAFVALYHWLTLSMPQWQAAAWVAGAVALAAFVLLLAGRSMTRSRNRYRQEIRNEIHALMGRLPGKADGADGSDVTRTAGLIAGAAVIGYILGKRLVK